MHSAAHSGERNVMYLCLDFSLFLQDAVITPSNLHLLSFSSGLCVINSLLNLLQSHCLTELITDSAAIRSGNVLTSVSRLNQPSSPAQPEHAR